MSRKDFFEQEKRKQIWMRSSLAILFGVVACVTIFVMYSQKLNNEAEENLYALTEEENIVSNDDLQETSFTQDKGVENTTNSAVEVELENTNKTVENTAKSPESKEPVSSEVKADENVVQSSTAEEVTEKESKEDENTEELAFVAPAEGEIIRDFAMETLIYSETLDEWCTHSGIDIKADKSSVVTASEKGKVESIKNDPRYGLTVIISHSNGFKTVYSNLLTTEFVQEGEEVEKGQTIATVGDTASFEIEDESHLHFEMYKDGVAVNPTIYFK